MQSWKHCDEAHSSRSFIPSYPLEQLLDDRGWLQRPNTSTLSRWDGWENTATWKLDLCYLKWTLCSQPVIYSLAPSSHAAGWFRAVLKSMRRAHVLHTNWSWWQDCVLLPLQGYKKVTSHCLGLPANTISQPWFHHTTLGFKGPHFSVYYASHLRNGMMMILRYIVGSSMSGSSGKSSGSRECCVYVHALPVVELHGSQDMYSKY